MSNQQGNSKEEEEKEKGFRLRKSLEELNLEALKALEKSLEQKEADLNNRLKKKGNMVGSLMHEFACGDHVALKKLDGMTSRELKVDTEMKGVISSRDVAMEDLRNVEQAFSDVHRKYERVKGVVENLKMNEDTLLQRDEEIQLAIAARDQKLEAFKQEVNATFEKMHNDFQAKLSMADGENSRLNAQLRRSEMRVETLQSELKHKQRENVELNTLADELIGKSGSGPL